jgi:hypothetical protein
VHRDIVCTAPAPLRAASSGTNWRTAGGLVVVGGVLPASYFGVLAAYFGLLGPMLLVLVLVYQPQLRAWRAEQRRLGQRRQRTLAQRRRIELVDVGRIGEFLELDEMTHEIEDGGQPELASLGVADLLERYVQLVEAQQRLLVAARRAEASPAILRGPGGQDESGRPRPRALQRTLGIRRSGLAVACRSRATQLHDQVEVIVEFIRLVRSHADCPPVHDDHHLELEAKLRELDELLEARRELGLLSEPREDAVVIP